jgi:hypothetical protein
MVNCLAVDAFTPPYSNGRYCCCAYTTCLLGGTQTAPHQGPGWSPAPTAQARHVSDHVITVCITASLCQDSIQARHVSDHVITVCITASLCQDSIQARHVSDQVITVCITASLCQDSIQARHISDHVITYVSQPACAKTKSFAIHTIFNNPHVFFNNPHMFKNPHMFNQGASEMPVITANPAPWPTTECTHCSFMLSKAR